MTTDIDQVIGQTDECGNFYVYTWTRPDTGDVFYVGKGTGVRSTKLHGRNQHFLRVIEKLKSLGLEPLIEKVAEDLSEDRAFELECSLIAKYGRAALGGTLTNMTDGGEGKSGYIYSEAEREARSIWATEMLSDPAVRKKLSDAGVIRYQRPGERERHSEMIKLRFSDPAERLKISDALRGLPKSKEHVENVSKTLLVSWQNPDLRINHQRLTLRRGPTKANATGFKGVSFDKSSGKWMAQIEVAGRNKHLGRFVDPAEAAKAYDLGVLKHYGPDVYLNFPSAELVASNDNDSTGERAKAA